MRIDNLIASRRPCISFEFFPPKTREGVEKLYETVAKLKEHDPAFVSVTYGAGGSTRDRTIEITKRIKNELGIEAMAHFTCVGATRDELHEVLDEMREAQFENVLALRGDPPQGEQKFTQTPGGLAYASDLAALISQSYDFCVGGACFPEGHLESPDLETDMYVLHKKIAAGARFLITQLFFDNGLYFDFVARARADGINVPIVPGIMPITNYEQIKRFTSMCGASIPESLMAELDLRAGDPEAIAELGVAYATLQCHDLLARGAPGIHFYTLNRSPATSAVVSALKAARSWKEVVAAEAKGQ